MLIIFEAIKSENKMILASFNLFYTSKDSFDEEELQDTLKIFLRNK